MIYVALSTKAMATNELNPVLSNNVTVILYMTAKMWFSLLMWLITMNWILSGSIRLLKVPSKCLACRCSWKTKNVIHINKLQLYQLQFNCSFRFVLVSFRWFARSCKALTMAVSSNIIDIIQ